MFTKRLFALLLLLGAGLLLVTGCTLLVHPTATTAPLPSTVTLPVGFRPEGVAVGAGSEFFVGSLGTLADENAPIVGGAIYRGDLRTGQGQPLVEAKAGQMAVGLQVDPRTHYLYVAGGMFGDVRVYNASTGQLVISYTLGSEGGFINDLVVTKAAVYATDSFLPFLYSVPLSSNGQPAGVTGAKLALGGEYAIGDGSYPFQANGIVATADGRWLIIVNSNTGKLYQVDPATGLATEISLGGQDVKFGDGLVLDGATLYVIQNYANQIAVVHLTSDPTTGHFTGSIVRVISKAEFAFNIPTTAALSGDALYVVNARFEDSAPLTAGTPDIDYALLRVPKVNGK